MAENLSLRENKDELLSKIAEKETPAGAQQKVDEKMAAHNAAPNPHPQYADVRHTHPTDITRAPVSSPYFDGNATFTGDQIPLTGLSVSSAGTGGVGANLAPNTSYRYYMTYINSSGVESLPGGHVVIATGPVAYPVNLSWPSPAALGIPGAANVRIYKNGRAFVTLAAATTSFQDNGTVASVAAVSPLDSQSVGATFGRFAKWGGGIFGTAQAFLNKVSAGDGMTYTVIDRDAKVYRAVYNDLAELFENEEGFISEPGDIVSATNNKITLSRWQNDPTVVGVHSDTYGFCLGGENKQSPKDNYDRFTPIGISGRVRAKIVGTVKEGDLIVASSIPGVGMVVDRNRAVPGTVVGKAVESSDDVAVKRVWILIMNR